MTFLEIAQTVRKLAGIQGSGPTSVVDATGVEAIIVQFVKDANTDLQSFRDDWDFMKASKTFTTVAGQREYTLTQIFTPSTPNIKTYDKISFRLTDMDGKIHVLPVDEYYEHFDLSTLNDTDRGRPGRVGISPARSVVLHKHPDNNYVVSFTYWRNPQTLSLNADVPWLPSAFHMLIAYKAMEKLGVHLSQPEIYRGFNVSAMQMLGQMMRTTLPKKRMVMRPMA